MPTKSLVISAVVVALSVGMSAQQRSQQGQPSPIGTVRVLTGELAHLMEVGYEKSPTFRSIVDHLAGTSVIVYVQLSDSLPSGTNGVLSLTAAAAGFRYLRVRLRVGSDSKTMVALLAHELQHALEIGHAPQVVDVDTLRDLYRTIGVPTCEESGRECYDTELAQRTGQLVLDEIGETPNETAPRWSAATTARPWLQVN